MPENLDTFDCPRCSGTNAVPYLNPRTGESIPMFGQVLLRCSDCGERFPVDAVTAMVRFPEFGLTKTQKCTACGAALPEGRIVENCPACAASFVPGIQATNRHFERKFRDRVIVGPICIALVLLASGAMWLFPAIQNMYLLVGSYGVAGVIWGVEGLLRRQAVSGNIFASRPLSGWQAVARNVGFILFGATFITIAILRYIEKRPIEW